jgi:hypothetical protein
MYIRVEVQQHLPAPPTGADNAPIIVRHRHDGRQARSVTNPRAPGGGDSRSGCVRQGDVLGAWPAREVKHIDAREDTPVVAQCRTADGAGGARAVQPSGKEIKRKKIPYSMVLTAR